MMSDREESALDRLYPDTVVELKCRRPHGERFVSKMDMDAARRLLEERRHLLAEAVRLYGKPIPNMPVKSVKPEEESDHVSPPDSPKVPTES